MPPFTNPFQPANHLHTKLHPKDNAAARRRLHRRIIDTLRKPTPYEGARDDANKISQRPDAHSARKR